MQLTQKIKIEPTEEQKEVLASLSEICRLLYNFSLKERKKNWQKNKNKPREKREHITYTDQQNKLSLLKKKYPKYKWVYSKVLQMTLRKLNADYKSFFSLWKGNEKARLPKYKGKKYFTTLCYNQSGFKITNGKIKFSHNHPQKTPLVFNIPKKFDFEDKKVKQVEIFRDEFKSEYYVCVSYEVEVPEYEDNGKYQAFDLGIIKHTAVNSEGKFIEFYNKRPYKYWERKIKEVQSKRDKCNRESNKWKWYNEKLKKMKRKCANQIKDFQHKQSKKIVENTKANTLIVGKIKVKKMNNKNKWQKRLHYSTHNTGYMKRIVRFLSYKAEKRGKKVIEISEINTTKMCCMCGKKENRKLYERTIKCDCGNEMDRDKNSAVNIMKRFLSQERSVNEQSIQDLLRQTVNGKTKVSQKRFGELAGSSLQ